MKRTCLRLPHLPYALIALASSTLMTTGPVSTAKAEIIVPRQSQVLSNGYLPGGTTIENTAYFDMTDNGNNGSSITSNTTTLTMQNIYTLNIGPDSNAANFGGCGQQTLVTAGQSGTLTYTLTNTGNVTQTYNTSTLAPNITGVNGTSATAASGSQIYQETNGQPGLQTGDGGDTLITTAIANVPAATDVTFYVSVPTPASATGDATYGVTPQGVSASDTSQVDNNNLGCVVIAHNLNLDMTQAPAQQAFTPDTKTFTHTLTNTGNYPLSSPQVSIDQSGGNFPVSFTASANGKTSPPQTTAQAAVQWVITNAFTDSLWPADSTSAITLNDTYTVPPYQADKTVNDVNLKPYIDATSDLQNGVNGTRTNNLLPQSAATDHHDVINVTGTGVGVIVKTQADCGTNVTTGCPSAATMRSNPDTYKAPLTVKACDIIKYGLFASNSGPGPIFSPVIRDIVPINMTALYINPLYGQKAPHLYRLDQGNWSTINSGQNDAQEIPDSSTIEFGYDANNDGDITAADQLAPNGLMGATIYAQVTGPNCTNPFTPGSNWEELP